jgi:hypothetical protein
MIIKIILWELEVKGKIQGMSSQFRDDREKFKAI